MSEEDFQGIAEHCYREDCDNWVTGSSDYCSEECEKNLSDSIEQADWEYPNELSQ